MKTFKVANGLSGLIPRDFTRQDLEFGIRSLQNWI